MKSAKNLAEKERSLAVRYGDYLNKNFGMDDLKKSDKKPRVSKRKSNTKQQTVTAFDNYFTRPTEKKSLPIMLSGKTKLTSKEPSLQQRQPNSKININFEIKNLNIFKTASSQPIKKGHRKTLTTLDQEQIVPHTAELKKPKHKPKLSMGAVSPKAHTGHRKTRSQDFNMPKGFDPNKFIAEEVESSMIGKCHVCSRAGMLEDKPKTNQDSFICMQRFVMNNVSLLGVCDGHGVNGHFVSEFIREILPQNIEYYSIRNKIFLE